MPKKSNLGKSLKKKQQRVELPEMAIFHHQTYADPNQKYKNLSSALMLDPVSDLLQKATLSNQQFEAQKETKVNQKIIINLNEQKPKEENTKLTELRIPRRPVWHGLTKEVLQQQENEAFLTWRKNIAVVEESGVTITPFEKNIEVWRQLWRVVERSDIVVQIVDGRDIWFFRCEDIEKYVKEVSPNKGNVLIINKSDLLSEEIRKIWSAFLNSKNIKHMFFSAKEEQVKIDEDLEDEVNTEFENSWQIANRESILKVLKRLAHEHHLKNQNLDNLDKSVSTVGVVGYPNVGKSSLVNVLCKKKLVGVAAMPGKTKHFQSLYLESDLMLCDCPGLVFPSAESNRSEMVFFLLQILNGVIPIHTLKETLSPLNLMCQRIPFKVMSHIYKIPQFDKKTIHNAENLIKQICSYKNFYTQGSGNYDITKCSRMTLQDYVNGVLLYCKLPPNCERDDVLQYNVVPDEPVQAPKIFSDDESSDEEIEGFFEQHKEHNNQIDELDEDTIVDLAEGKKVGGMKLTKNQRREVKHAIKRGENIDVLEFLKQNYEETINIKKKMRINEKEEYTRIDQRVNLKQ